MRVRVGVAMLVGFLLVLGPGLANADDRASLEAGRTAGRGLLILSDPAVCAIALVRERCKADVEAFLGDRGDADFKDIPHIGAHPLSGLRAFVATGDRDRFDSALGYINSRQSDAAMWTADARGAALYDAGIEAVMLPAAGGVTLAEILSAGPVTDIMDHAAQVPAGSLPVAVPSPKPAGPGAARFPEGAIKFAHYLVDALDGTMPAPALASTAFADGPAGDAALGVAGSTVAELIDSPVWLFQPDSQRFIDGWTARLTAVAPRHTAEIAAFRERTRAKADFSHDAAIKSYNGLMKIVPQRDGFATRFMLGAFAAQLVYNAAILRNQDVAAMMSSVLADGSELDASVPGWSRARAAAKASAQGPWSSQYQNGVLLVALIEKANQP